MSNVTIQKRGKFYQYKFEIAKVDGKRKFVNKSEFNTKDEAIKAGNSIVVNVLETIFRNLLKKWYLFQKL